jgi:hypothetical protein
MLKKENKQMSEEEEKHGPFAYIHGRGANICACTGRSGLTYTSSSRHILLTSTQADIRTLELLQQACQPCVI